MPKLVIWSESEATLQLRDRLRNAKEARKSHEYKWERNERTIYGGGEGSSQISYSFDSETDLYNDEADNSSDLGMSVNYAFKNLRFIHAQMSANPPSAVIRPTSNDTGDRRKADAADRLIRHALRAYKLQEKFDVAALDCLLYGTSFIKTRWDAERGDILEFDEETDEITMTGDIDVSVVTPWDVFVDPDVNTWEEARFVFQKVVLPYEEALFRWPEQEELLKRIREKSNDNNSGNQTQSALTHNKFDVVEVYEYWEKGLPLNGMLGRFGICTETGDQLVKIGPNPFRFSPPREGEEDDKKPLPPTAQLPFHIFTDIDVPGSIWGKSFVEYEAPLQDILNRLDIATLDNIQAHSAARIILPEGAEIADGSITNSPLDVIKISGSMPPHFMETPKTMPDTHTMRDRVKGGLDDMAGVNPSMMGQQEREQSGFSMQYATNQGNMIRRRLFNKYVLLTESVYKSYLNLIRKHWSEKRTIYVLGREKAFEAIDIKGADVDGGFDIVVEYGASLSLDPTSRREEIMQMMPLFEKAGVDPRELLPLVKLNELEGMFDKLELSKDRMREIIEEIIATKLPVEVREMQQHKYMLAYAYEYLMTSEFKGLDEETKSLIENHVTEREKLAAKPAGGGEALAGAMGGGAGGPPSPPGAGAQAGPAASDQPGVALGPEGAEAPPSIAAG